MPLTLKAMKYFFLAICYTVFSITLVEYAVHIVYILHGNQELIKVLYSACASNNLRNFVFISYVLKLCFIFFFASEAMAPDMLDSISKEID